MGKPFIRTFQQLDFSILQEHTLLYGALSGMCSKCKNLHVALNDQKCKECGTEFKYIAFQSVKQNMPKLLKMKAERPSMEILDYDDYKRIEGEIKARDILG